MPTLTTDRPLKDAVEQISQRLALGSSLSAAEWDLVPAEIRLRVMFSARVEHEQLLGEMQQRLQQKLEMARSQEPAGKEGVLMERRRFIDEMRGELDAIGYRPDPKKAGGLQDLTSDKRLGLIWKMNISQAQGYAQWLAGQTPTALLMYPAMEFVRLEQRTEIRAWATRWAALGGKFFPGTGPYPQGRMMALVNDPIWVALNRFGVPWKPFDWGSGMGTRKVPRREALALGIIKQGDPPQEPRRVPYNAKAKASLKGISPARRRVIEDTFMGDVEIEGDEIRILPPQAKDSMSAQRRKTDWIPSGIITAAALPPDRIPLTEKMRIEESISYLDLRGRVEQTISLANSVIGGGNLPPALTRFGSPLITVRPGATYMPSAGGQVNPLWINDQMPGEPGFAELTWLHEAGHLIDNYGLHRPEKNAFYASENHPGLAEVMQEINRSTAAARFRNAYGADDHDATPREFFARAFAQYIAAESGDADLTRVLLKWRSGAYESAGWPRDFHWHRADFGPIRKALRRLFSRNGWKGGDQ